MYFLYSPVALSITLNLFLSEVEQIQRIDEAENVKTSSAFSFAQEQPQPDPAVWEYNGVKERHPDDMDSCGCTSEKIRCLKSL